jgi:hypothetical protein
MFFIYCLNIISSFIFIFIPIFIGRFLFKIQLVNPISIPIFVYLPLVSMKMYIAPFLILENAIKDAGYQMALFVFSISQISVLIGSIMYYITFQRLVDLFINERKNSISILKINHASKIFILLYLLLILIISKNTIGILEWISNPRLGYQLNRGGYGVHYALAYTFISIAMVLDFFSKIKVKNLLLSSVKFFVLGYLLGTKGIFIQNFICLLIFIYFIDKKSINKIIIFGLPIILLIMTINLYMSIGSNFGLNEFLSYFDHYINASMYYNEFIKGGISLFNGEILISSFWGYVPRGIFPDKPYVYGTLLVNELFYPGQAELTNTPAFDGGVEQFADFGIIGVVFTSIFGFQAFQYGALSSAVFNSKFHLEKRNIFTIMIFLVMFTPGFGVYFSGIYYFLLLLITLVTINFINKFKL